MGLPRRLVAAVVLAFVAGLVPAGPARADTYLNYAHLAANQVEGVDYRIEAVNRETRIAVIAPHAGGIEPGTSEVARAIAGEGVGDDDWSLYLFEGIKPIGNSVLHITSTNFDEPWARFLATQTNRVVTIHGTDGAAPVTYVGGRDTFIRDRVINALRAAGFPTHEATGDIAGTEPSNITNAGLTGRGVQLELALEMRRSLFGEFTASGRWDTRNTRFHRYVAAVRTALAATGYRTP